MHRQMILLHNGIVIDGSGQPSRRGSILINNRTIESVGAIDPAAGMEVVDCSDRVIAPGFIDVHSHADLEVMKHRPEKVMQGVTTEVVGNCGFFPIPDDPLVGPRSHVRSFRRSRR